MDRKAAKNIGATMRKEADALELYLATVANTPVQRQSATRLVRAKRESADVIEGELKRASPATGYQPPRETI